MLTKLSVQVPRTAWPDIREFLQTPTEKLAQLVHRISASGPRPDIEDLVDEIASPIGVSPAVVEKIVTLAVNFSYLQRELASSSAEVLESIADALERGEFPDWKTQYASAWKERERLLGELLATDGAIETMSKARELLSEFQCVIRGSMVITDVRHVYNDAVTDVKGGLVVNTLALEYFEGQESRQIHVTLSSDAVATLICQLQRAEKKIRLATDLLQKTGIPELTPKRNLQP